MQVPALCFGELSSGSDSSSHRGYGVAYLHCAWLEKGEEKKRGGESFLCLHFDPLVQAASAVGHWSDMVMSQVQPSNVIVHLMAVQ